MKYKTRPLTKRIITCIKLSGRVEVDGKLSYAGCTSQELIYKLHVTPNQFYRAISALIKSGRVERVSPGLYWLPLTDEQKRTLGQFAARMQDELDKATTINHIEDHMKTMNEAERIIRGNK